jgi:hypothetical protein
VVAVVVSIDSAIELTPTGLVEAFRSWQVRRKLVRPLERLIGALISEPPYCDLIEGRARAHVFLEFEESARTVEAALFPLGEEWCQLGAISEERRSFLPLSQHEQLERVVGRIKALLDSYLHLPNSDPPRKKRGSRPRRVE